MALASLLRSTVFRRSLSVVLLLAGVAAAVIGVVGWHANSILTRASTKAVDADMAELRTEFQARGIEGLLAAVRERSRAKGTGLYRFEDETGKRIAGNLERMPGSFAGGTHAGTFTYHPKGTASGTRRTAAGVLIEIDHQAFLVVARDIEDQRALLFAIYRSVGLGALVLAVLGIGGGMLIARHILRRIDAMGQASAGIMAGNLAGRIPLDGSGDELDRLAIRLNGMLDRIEQLMAGMREVSDNIAHDLRTPLNRLRNRAEAALSDGRGGEAWREGLERVIDEADELIKTFNALLLIARLEAGTSPEQVETLDVAEVVRDLAELYEPVAEEAGFVVACSSSGPLPVSVNRQLIGQSITNLIDNALKYAAAAAKSDPKAREISVSARRDGTSAVIAVADRGPGIPPGDRERALRRFVRLEQSRTLPGTGLGLSLVAAVARLHGGTIRLEDNAPGLRVVMSLPLAIAPSSVQSSSETARKSRELAAE
jgi:signal transduction histidine kinase